MKINFGEKFIEKDAPITVFEAASELELASRSTLVAVVNGKVREMLTQSPRTLTSAFAHSRTRRARKRSDTARLTFSHRL